MSVTKSNEIVNRLNRTKKELYPDLAREREAYDVIIRSQRKEAVQAQKKQDKAAKAEAERQKDLRSYKHLMQVSRHRSASWIMLVFASAQRKWAAPAMQHRSTDGVLFRMQDDSAAPKQPAAQSFQEYEDDFM